jgi:hypothetical protein
MDLEGRVGRFVHSKVCHSGEWGPAVREARHRRDRDPLVLPQQPFRHLDDHKRREKPGSEHGTNPRHICVGSAHGSRSLSLSLSTLRFLIQTDQSTNPYDMGATCPRRSAVQDSRRVRVGSRRLDTGFRPDLPARKPSDRHAYRPCRSLPPCRAARVDCEIAVSSGINVVLTGTYELQRSLVNGAPLYKKMTLNPADAHFMYRTLHGGMSPRTHTRRRETLPRPRREVDDHG